VDETLVPEVLEDSKCPRRLDPWSREWMEYTGGNLTSPDAKAGAEQVLDLMASEQVKIEKMHSQVRQFLIGRSVQSRAVDLGTLISHKLLDHAKEGVAEEKRRRKLTLRERRAPQEREGPPQQKRTRRMSSWEVYRSEQTRGKAAEERPTQKEMSDAYSALPPGERARLDKAAAEANEAVSEGNKNPLGVRRGRAPRADHNALDDVIKRVLEEPDFLMAHLQLDDVWKISQHARTAHRNVNVQARGALHKEYDTLRAWAHDSPLATDSITTFASALEIDEEGGRFGSVRAAISSTGVTAFEWRCPEAFDAAERITTLKTRRGEASHVSHEEVMHAFRTYQQTVQDRSVPAVAAARPPARTKRLCFLARRCLCSPWGRRVCNIDYVIKLATLQAYKKTNVDWCTRKVLLAGGVVVGLFGGLPQEGAAPSEVAPVCRWFLVADVMLSPYELFLEEMKPVEPVELDLAIEAGGAALVERPILSLFEMRTLHRNPSHWDVAAEIDQTLVWHLAFFEVELNSQRPVGIFTPNGVLVRLRRRNIFEFFPRRRRAGHPPPVALGDRDEDEPDELHDGGDDIHVDDDGGIHMGEP